MDFKLSPYGIQRHRLSVRGFILVLAGVVFLSGIPIVGVALDKDIPQDIGINGRQLEFKANDVTWNPKKSLVVLTGNVKIVQGETVIVAENTTIFFTKEMAAEQTLNADSFEKIVANGNVRIELKIGVATSEKAVYVAETKRLVLSGTPAKFVSSDNTKEFTGSTITVDRETGNVGIEDAEAVIDSEGNI